jgi:hypothetical protein
MVFTCFLENYFFIYSAITINYIEAFLDQMFNISAESEPKHL